VGSGFQPDLQRERVRGVRLQPDLLLGGSLQRFRMVAMLSAAVMVVGIVAGAIFL